LSSTKQCGARATFVNLFGRLKRADQKVPQQQCCAAAGFVMRNSWFRGALSSDRSDLPRRAHASRRSTMADFINVWIDQITLDGTMARIRSKWVGNGTAPDTAPP
jgi:hypothetical protein